MIFVLPHSRVPESFPLTPPNKNPSSPAETTTATSKKQSPLNRYQWGASPRWFIILLKVHSQGRAVRLERKSPDRLAFNSTARVWKKKTNVPQLLSLEIKAKLKAIDLSQMMKNAFKDFI